MKSPKKEANQRKKFNVLILGAGNQGCMSDIPGSENEHKIISFANAFKKHEKTNRLMINDINHVKAQQAAKTWNCWHVFNLDIAFNDSNLKPDIVVVSTSDDTHYEVLKELSKYSPKLVIVEKPICTELEQAREIVKLYKEKEIPLLVNYTRRFLPHYDYLEQYGKPVYATCAFNRGWLHTGTHAIDFFNMINAENYRMIEMPTEAYRVWDLKVYYENHVFSEIRVGDMPVWDYYDNSMWYLAENAYNFLEGKEDLKCTGEMALKDLEICYELMNK